MKNSQPNRRDFIKSAFGILGASVFSPFIVSARRKEINGLFQDKKFTRLIYSNSLSNETDIKNFVLEGKAIISFPNKRMRMENALDPSLGQASNFVFWCPEDFPSDISIRWKFLPIREPGLCILFFAAKGINGEDIFDSRLQKRNGNYKQYHSGNINAYHVSYFRRKHPAERVFHTCNLRKSKGFHLVVQGADPIASVGDIINPYSMRLDKYGGNISFYVNNLLIFNWIDDGKTFGPILGAGKIGFRQMAPLQAEYFNLEVYTT